MAKVGRPTKLTEKMKERLQIVARQGLTEKEMCNVLGITEKTINNWKNKHPEFLQSLKDWKTHADADVEKSLYQRATGYEHPEDKIFNDSGKPLIVPTIKHYPPDATSMIFWLKNRQPKKWRDKTEQEITLSDDLTDRLDQALNRKRKHGENG